MHFLKQGVRHLPYHWRLTLYICQEHHHRSRQLCSIISFSIDRSRCTDLKKYRMVPLTGQTTGKGRKIKCMSK